MKKNDIEDVKNWLIINNPNIIIISKYRNIRAEATWQCNNNHIFTTKFSCIKKNKNCPICYNQKRNNSLGKINKWLQINHPEATCLSKEYIGPHEQMIWQCEKQHSWKATFNHIKYGTWCPTCHKENNNYSITKIIDWINTNHAGSKCLSESYKNVNEKMKWQCKNNHIWENSFRHIVNKNWCKKCYNESMRLSLDNIKSWMQDNHPGAKCLSENYINNRTIMNWQCEKNHIFTSNFNNVKNNRWCPDCRRGYGERCCKLFFETVFNKPFVKCRPNFLKYKHKVNLELDGFCNELNIAFEYQGRQHYEVVKEFRITEQKLKEQKERDEFKFQKCKENNIKLVVIPYFDNNFKPNNLIDFMKLKFPKLNIDSININFAAL